MPSLPPINQLQALIFRVLRYIGSVAGWSTFSYLPLFFGLANLTKSWLLHVHCGRACYISCCCLRKEKANEVQLKSFSHQLETFMSEVNRWAVDLTAMIRQEPRSLQVQMIAGAPTPNPPR
jgi:hypothetical protein